MQSLTKNDFEAAAKSIGTSVPVIKAVYKVETAGSGFLKDGRLKILFEGHEFYRQLVSAGANPIKMAERYPTILYKKWTRKHYKGGAAEWDRLSIAIKICNDLNLPTMLALNSASYGAFQIMGYNCTKMGYATAQEVITTWNTGGEPKQLIDFCKYVKSVGLADELQAISFTTNFKAQAKHWQKFAFVYNGSGYKGSLLYDWDDYDLKLAKEFQIETALAA